MGCLKLTYYENETPLKVVQGNFLSEKKSCAGAYRYGFNGKEKDSKGEWGSSTHYDYGFRIYKPSIGRFLSVDPLTKSYPMLTPYQFASNTPISAIDLDGLEALITITGTWWQDQITEALNNNDIQRASYLAFKAISTTLDDIEPGSQSYAEKNWKGNAPGTYNWSEQNPKGLTVVFDGASTPAFTIVEQAKPSHWYSDTFLEPIIEALVGGEGGGFAFFTSGSGVGSPIGHVRKGKTDGFIDIKPLMDVIGASRDAATNGPAKNIVEGIGQIVTAYGMGESMRENYDALKQKAPDEGTSVDSCAFCHQTGPKGSLKTKDDGGIHSGPILPTKKKQE